MTLATRIGVLDAGRLVQVGTPQQIYENPGSAHVASRLGSPRINLIARAALGEWPAPPAAATVGVRAEHLHVHAAATGAASALRATVQRIEILSDQRLVHLALAGSGARLISAAPARGTVEPGRDVEVELGRPLWFDAAGHRVAA